MIAQILLLAQGTPAAPPPGGGKLIIGMLLFVGVFFFMTHRTQKRERQKKEDLLNNLAKNDRVMTIGGVIGTIVAVKDNQITLKVDENTNTRMTFIRRSIQQVIRSDEDLDQAQMQRS